MFFTSRSGKKCKSWFHRFSLNSKVLHTHHQGYVLPLTVGLGLAMIMMGLTATMMVQTDRTIANSRKQTGETLAIAESGVERVMLQLSRPENAILLSRNHDPINPSTGQAYLGPDGIPSSNDETAVSLDEWTGYSLHTYPCFQQAGVGAPQFPALLTGNLSGGSSYRLLAYRYNPYQQVGHLLVEGTHSGRTTRVAVSIRITPELNRFPGLAVQRDVAGSSWMAKLVARGRMITGTHANLYYPANSSANPSLTGIATPTDSTRAAYRQAVWADPALDGAAATETIGGNLIACNPDFRDYVYENEFGAYIGALPSSGSITTTTTITGTTGTVISRRYDAITLDNNETLTVDTTNGPVHLFLTAGNGNRRDAITLNGNAKIINIRTDGKPPRVGDLRLLATGDNSGGGVRVKLYGQSCIENAYMFMPYGDLMLMTTAGGCPTTPSANAVGVFWLESFLGSKNNASNRNQSYQGTNEHDTLITPGTTSGIRVPEDVSSVYDVLRFVRIPMRYRLGDVARWQQVR
jgi:hypothetical protein